VRTVAIILLQAWGADFGIRAPGPDHASEATRLAVELIRRCFQRTNRQDYARLLHPMLA
jgi:hypothetical protein